MRLTIHVWVMESRHPNYHQDSSYDCLWFETNDTKKRQWLYPVMKRWSPGWWHEGWWCKMAGGSDGPSPQRSGTEALAVEGPPRVRNKKSGRVAKVSKGWERRLWRQRRLGWWLRTDSLAMFCKQNKYIYFIHHSTTQQACQSVVTCFFDRERLVT